MSPLCGASMSKESVYNQNFLPPKNEVMRFLILKLDDLVFPRWNCSKIKSDKDIVSWLKLPGKLEVINFHDYDVSGCAYNIEDSPMPNTLYIKLPFINLYVTSDKYKSRLTQQKHDELKKIFVTLGAKQIKWKTTQNNDLLKSFNFEGGAQVHPTVDVEVGLSGSKQKNTGSSEYNCMKFNFVDKINQISYCDFQNDNFNFLTKDFSWQDMVRRRIDNGLIDYTYTFTSNDTDIFTTKITNRLKLLNLQFDFESKTSENIYIEYKIKFYPIESRRNKYSQPIDKNTSDEENEDENDTENDDNTNNDFKSVESNYDISDITISDNTNSDSTIPDNKI